MDNDQKIIDWQEKIQHWQASGLTQKAWCKQHNIRPKQFSHWKSKLASSSQRPCKKKGKESEAPSINNFVPVALDATPVPEEVLMVSLPSGASITGIGEHNVQLVSQLLQWIQ